MNMICIPNMIPNSYLSLFFFPFSFPNCAFECFHTLDVEKITGKEHTVFAHSDVTWKIDLLLYGPSIAEQLFFPHLLFLVKDIFFETSWSVFRTLLQILREVWSEMWIFTCIQQIFSIYRTCFNPPTYMEAEKNHKSNSHIFPMHSSKFTNYFLLKLWFHGNFKLLRS